MHIKGGETLGPSREKYGRELLLGDENARTKISTSSLLVHKGIMRVLSKFKRGTTGGSLWTHNVNNGVLAPEGQGSSYLKKE